MSEITKEEFCKRFVTRMIDRAGYAPDNIILCDLKGHGYIARNGAGQISFVRRTKEADGLCTPEQQERVG